VIAQQLVSLEVGVVEGVPAEEDSGARRRGETAYRRCDGRAQPGRLGALQPAQKGAVPAIPGVREHHHFGLRAAIGPPGVGHVALVFLLLLVDVREVDPRVRQHLRLRHLVSQRAGLRGRRRARRVRHLPTP